MQESYNHFRNQPSQELLNKIIDNAREALINSPINTKGTGMSVSLAKSYAWYWLLVDDDPALITNKNTIDKNFNEILGDIDVIDLQNLSAETKNIYLNIINEFAKKIKNVYRL
jgi:hypothetical protein